MTEEFKKARDEAAQPDPINAKGIRDHCFLRGADWAYDWLTDRWSEKHLNIVDKLMNDLDEEKQKLSIAVEALEGYASVPGKSREPAKQAISKIRGENG